MELIDTLRTQKLNALSQKCLFIAGARCFSNELIGYYLKNECSVQCVVCDHFDELPVNGEKGEEQKSLLLIDVSGLEIKKLLFQLEDEYRKIISHYYVALFNMEHQTGIEKEALHSGIRGFFYKSDSTELFLKGVLTMSQGQLWVSRDVLEKWVVEDMNGFSHAKVRKEENSNHNLTKREMEILALVTVGSKNDDIADKLCISPHTVKTHLYNVFKKINVADRLQAALWAVKNLG